MSALTCGRCGQRTAIGSIYCPRCRWVLLSSRPHVTTLAGGDTSIHQDVMPEPPTGPSGMMARRRVDKARAQVERELENLIEPRLEQLQKDLKDNGDDAQLHFRLGTILLLRSSFERAIAHLQRAHQLEPQNRDVLLNLAVALAQRGQLQPSLMTLGEARTLFPNDADVLLNIALVALQARRPQVTFEATTTLEKLWEDNNALIEPYYESTMTARGLALLLLKKPDAAKVALHAAANYQTGSHSEFLASSSTRSEDNGDSAFDVERSDEEIAAKFAILSETPQSDEFTRPGGHVTGADFLNNLAIVEVELGALELAQQHLNMAVRIEPANARVDSNLGILAFERGEIPTAFKYLDIARQIEESSSSAEPATHNHLGIILSSLGRNDEAWREFGIASGHTHADFEVWYNLGRAYIEAGKTERGVSYLRKAFSLDPQHPDVHALLAASYLMRGHIDSAMLDEAIKHFKRALQLNGRHLSSLLGLAMACEQAGNAQGAQVVLAQAIKLYPRSAPVLFLRALFTMRLQDDAEHLARAGTHFVEARSAQVDLVACDYNAALCQYLMGMQDAAAHQLEAVVRFDPSFTPAYYLIGVGHAAGERYDQALKAWQTALQQDSQNADLHADMGFAYYSKKDWQNAIDSYYRAAQLAPEDADIMASLGLCCGRVAGTMRDAKRERESKKANTLLKNTMGVHARDAEEARLLRLMLERSISAFQRSLQLKPQNPITHSNLGLSLYFQNEVEKAVDQWRIVSQLDARYAEKREEDQYRNFDDSQMALRPVLWRDHVVGMSPVLPPPHTRLVPGYNSRNYRLALPDQELQRVQTMRRQLDHTTRLQSWMNAKRT